VPLRAGKDAWAIGTVEEEFAGVLLTTDGIYDAIFHPLLDGKPYTPLLRYFMDNNLLKVSDETIAAVGKEREDYLKSDACAAITDDMAVIVLINEGIEPQIDESCYAEPDWKTLELELDKKLYPHRYKKEHDLSVDNDANAPPVKTGAEEENKAAHAVTPMFILPYIA